MFECINSLLWQTRFHLKFLIDLFRTEDHFTRLTGRQRTHILTEHDLLKFNKVVGSDIEIFGKALKLKQTDIDASRVENSNSFTTLIHKIILKWKNTNARNATLGLFTKGLQDAEAAGASIDWDSLKA